ncbi:MAG: preprotein translocase subunit SecE [Frankiaceae bacterium]|nr:preprotein translocase subunit SecE [Frankiaceae bacterium]
MTQTSERTPAPSPAGGGRGAKRPGVGSRISTYNRQVVAELRKVIWPTRNELVTYTVVTLVFVTAMVALVSLYDLVFTKGVLSIFG